MQLNTLPKQNLNKTKLVEELENVFKRVAYKDYHYKYLNPIEIDPVERCFRIDPLYADEAVDIVEQGLDELSAEGVVELEKRYHVGEWSQTYIYKEYVVKNIHK